MTNETYKMTLDTATAEMAELLRERNEIDKKLSKLAPVVEYLSALCDSHPTEPSALDIGLTDAIRRAFKDAAPRSLSPIEVRDKLRESGFRLDRYASELPPIHNTILRLKKNGEIEEGVPTREGRVYKWVSGLKRAIAAIDPPVSWAANEVFGRLLNESEVHDEPPILRKARRSIALNDEDMARQMENEEKKK